MAGRPKGSKNKADPTVFVSAVERALAKGTNDNLINLVCRHIKSDKPASLPMLLRLLDMKFGKPIQPTELSNKEGESLRILVEHIGNAQNTLSAETN